MVLEAFDPLGNGWLREADPSAELGERQASIDGDTRAPIVGTLFTWDADVVAEEAPLGLDGATDYANANRWHYEPGSFRPLAKRGLDGTLLSIANDHLGTPREMFDERGNLRWAASCTTWGAVRSIKALLESTKDEGQAIYRRANTKGSVALKPAPENATHYCPIRFQGQLYDEETALYYNRYRHYDPLYTQYASPDPIGLEGGDRPQGYVGHPHVCIDPLGLEAVPPLYKNIYPEDPIPGGSGRGLFYDGTKWRLDSTTGVRTPDGTFAFVTRKDGTIAVARNLNHKGQSAHLKISRGADVRYAGQVTFNNGEVTSWSNESGHYVPSAGGAPSAGLPMGKFSPLGPAQ